MLFARDDELVGCHLGETLEHVGRLSRVQEHAPHFDRIPHAPLPADQARRRPPALAQLDVQRGQIARAEADEGVLAAEQRHHHLAGVAGRQNLSAVRIANLHHRVFGQVPAGRRLTLEAQIAGFGRAVALANREAVAFQVSAQRRGQRLRRHPGDPQRPCFRIVSQLLCFLQQRLQVARQADVAGDAHICHELHLLLHVANAARNHRTPDSPQTLLEHSAGWRHVVSEGVERDVTRSKAGGLQRRLPAPVIGHRGFGIVDGARGLEDTAQLAWFDSQQPTKRRILSLHRQEIILAGHRNARQIGGVGDVGRGEAGGGQLLCEGRRALSGMGNDLAYLSIEPRIESIEIKGHSS